jgi:hypothetical protein
MTNFAKVKDHTGLIRDMNSKAILNIDKEALNDHRRKKAVMKKIVEDTKRIDKIENDVCEIKQMLIALMNKN